MLLAKEKKPLWGEKSMQDVRYVIFLRETGKFEKTLRLCRWTWGNRTGSELSKNDNRTRSDLEPSSHQPHSLVLGLGGDG